MMDGGDAFAEELKRKVLDSPEGREALRQEQEAVMKEAEAEQRLKLKEKQEELGDGKSFIPCALRWRRDSTERLN